MCDRGKNTKLVWEYFYNLQKNYSHHIVLLGNHEDMFNLAIKRRGTQNKRRFDKITILEIVV